MKRLSEWYYSLKARRLRFWWERRTRGFDEPELWCLNSHIVDFLLPRLKAFREGVPVVPAHLLYGGEGESYEASLRLSKRERKKARAAAKLEWERRLAKMVRALELFADHGGFIPRENRDEFEEGWKLFHDHLFDLWW